MREGGRNSPIVVESSLSGRTLTTRVIPPRRFRKFFNSLKFDLVYDDEVSAGDPVLSIPGVAMVLPVAWIIGADVSVRCLDRTFVSAAERLQREFKKIYPKAPFESRLFVEETRDSPANPSSSAMLFSGGLDATYSFFANRHRRPRLIQMLGTDFPLSNSEYVRFAQRETQTFAARHGVEASFVRTNAMELFDQRYIGHRFWKLRENCKGDLWKGIGYAFGHLAMAAPLSAGRFDQLIIAAWADRDHADRMQDNPDASSPAVDRHIAWSNLRVEHHGCLHRYEKTIAMKDWVAGNLLRVCWFPLVGPADRSQLNCCRCEKCARSIIALAVAGVDPRECGFIVDEETLDYMSNLLSELPLAPSHFTFWWKPMQDAVPTAIDCEPPELACFLEWFRDLDLGDGIDPEANPWSIEKLYYSFPYWFSTFVRSVVYGVIGEPVRK